jgi:hypothetical protein
VNEAIHLTTLFNGKVECVGAREGMEIVLP